jgi:hypothetical protein
MTKPNFTGILILLTIAFSSFGQNNCGITVDTTKILLDENLDSFVTSLKSEQFQTFRDKKNIPSFIKVQLDCLTKDKFSLANPGENYICCCTSSQELPRRQLLFFSLNKDVFLITYLTGGIGVSTTILLAKLKDDKIVDIWTGYGFPKFKSKEEVIKHITAKRKLELGLHGGYVSI